MTDKPHILKQSKRRPFPASLFFLDTETNLKHIEHKTKVHSLKMGICQRHDRISDFEIVKRSEIVIRHKRDFIQWLDPQIKQKSHFYLIAHNVIYDATILDLFRELPKIGFGLTSLYSKGQTCIIRWKRGNANFTMIDNGNIFSGTLERWGAIFNIPKIEIDFDTCNDRDLIIYCRRDVEIMVKAWQVWMSFIYHNDCGGFRETVGSTAFNAWRHKYLSSEVFVHKDKAALTLERAAYHGGRVEAFHQGKLTGDRFYYLDINNMYGFIMLRSPFPVGLQGYTNRMGVKRMIDYLNRYSIVARVIVNVDEPAFITKVNGHTAYPLGRFETCLTTNEITYALEHGYLENVIEFAWYRSDRLFAEYVSEFYDLRLKYRNEKNSGFEAICKLLINSLYGKFGQTGIRQEMIGRSQPDEIWHMPVINAQTGARSYQTAIGGTIFEEFHEGESYHAMPAIAAHVTANARLYLLGLIKRAGWENVFYCDTDSLIVNQAGYYNLENEIEPDRLGKLKVETVSDWLIVNAPKDYEMSERRKVKGIRSNAVEIAEGVFLQEQWVKLAGLIRDGFSSGYTSKEIVKHQSRIIYSGVVTGSGKIEPFHL